MVKVNGQFLLFYSFYVDEDSYLSNERIPFRSLHFNSFTLSGILTNLYSIFTFFFVMHRTCFFKSLEFAEIGSLLLTHYRKENLGRFIRQYYHSSAHHKSYKGAHRNTRHHVSLLVTCSCFIKQALT